MWVLNWVLGSFNWVHEPSELLTLTHFKKLNTFVIILSVGQVNKIHLWRYSLYFSFLLSFCLSSHVSDQKVIKSLPLIAIYFCQTGCGRSRKKSSSNETESLEKVSRIYVVAWFMFRLLPVCVSNMMYGWVGGYIIKKSKNVAGFHDEFCSRYK